MSRLHVCLLLLICATTQAFIAPSPHLKSQGKQAHTTTSTSPPRRTTATMSVAAPSGLTLDEIAPRLKFEVFDLDAGQFGLDSKDFNYGIEIEKVTVPLKPSLGLGLEELAAGRDGRGMVLIGTVTEDGNAGQSGKVHVGDMITWLGREPTEMTRVEGLDLDQTMTALRNFPSSGATSITLVLKRLVKRATINVTFVYTDKEEKEKVSTMTMLAGSNLRREMIRQGLPVYDKETKRFDQPYITGNCAGEGLCGTCLVQVLGGKEHLNSPDVTERMVLDKWQGLTWRLSCRTVVGTDNKPSDIKLKITPQKGFHKK